MDNKEAYSNNICQYHLPSFIFKEIFTDDFHQKKIRCRQEPSKLVNEFLKTHKKYSKHRPYLMKKVKNKVYAMRKYYQVYCLVPFHLNKSNNQNNKPKKLITNIIDKNIDDTDVSNDPNIMSDYSNSESTPSKFDSQPHLAKCYTLFQEQTSLFKNNPILYTNLWVSPYKTGDAVWSKSDLDDGPDDSHHDYPAAITNVKQLGNEYFYTVSFLADGHVEYNKKHNHIAQKL